MTFPKAKDKPIYDKISEYFANAADLGGGRQKSHIEAEERKKKQSQKASKASSIELNGSFSSNSEKSDNCDPLWKSPTKQRKSSEHFEESDFSDFDRNDSSADESNSPVVGKKRKEAKRVIANPSTASRDGVGTFDFSSYDLD